ncbi:MAG TPA: glycoside hydrolase domain-containing protein, partial [Ktedonobacteraceae bacterium]|nr:glycoside hydrolase domain-containing protein [Ktedonobacteraceae bacterium]
IDHSCIEAVNAFLEGWNYELGSHNRLAGVYASASNYPALGKSNISESLFAWIAGGSSWAQRYDQACSVFGNKYVSDVSWNSHQRIYQYTGGHRETYGRQTWNIDSNCADAPMVGHVRANPIVVQFQLF